MGSNLNQHSCAVLAITRKRRNLNVCQCLATGLSYRYGQFSSALHKSKSSGGHRLQATAARSPASRLPWGVGDVKDDRCLSLSAFW